MRTSKAGTSTEEGFTLIEFVFIIFILSIFFGLALPRIKQQISPDPLRISATRLAKTIQRVRSHAISEGELLRLRLRFPGGEWKVEGVNSSGQWLELADSPVRKGRLAEGIRLLRVRVAGRSDIGEGEAFLRFLPTGETRKAALFLSGGDEKVRTLSIHPFINDVEISHGRVDF